MAKPSDSLIVLDRLEQLGFNDKAFAALHHFREGGRRTTIARHRAYCEKTESFDDAGENERTQRRLKLVLAGYLLGGFSSGNQRVFISLAEAAFAEVPTLAAAQRAPRSANRLRDNHRRGGTRARAPSLRGQATAFMINVDLETRNTRGGGGTNCDSRMHERFGRHYDLTVHTLACGSRTARSAHRPPTRYWDDNNGEGYALEEAIARIRKLHAQNPNAHPRRCRVCGVEAVSPDWD
jgi:hypothetical protein